MNNTLGPSCVILGALLICGLGSIAGLTDVPTETDRAALDRTLEGHGGNADVIYCDMPQARRWGTLNGITSYSIASTSKNVGTVNLDWIENSNRHPIIPQNMYRIMDDRLEQIGQGWMKHSFCALQLEICGACNRVGGCLNHLRPGCSDPYTANRNGGQARLGPKWEVNAVTGFYPWPHQDRGVQGDVIFKRIQVHNEDLGIPGAEYLFEGAYFSLQDTQAGNQNNNVSYRRVSVTPDPFNVSFNLGATVQEQAALDAWQTLVPGVQLSLVDVTDDGRFRLGVHVSDNGDGTWHYELALYNFNSDRSGGSFSIPVPDCVIVTNAGFHDVDYHSGDGIDGVTQDGTDWTVTVAGGAITWETAENHDENTNANALRWNTTYTFRFDADAPPADTDATIGLFKPGSPDSVTLAAAGPSAKACGCVADLDGSGAVDFGDILAVLRAWGNAGGPEDLDQNGIVDFGDILIILAAWGPCP